VARPCMPLPPVAAACRQPQVLDWYKDKSWVGSAATLLPPHTCTHPQDTALCELADAAGASRMPPWSSGMAAPDPGLGRRLLGVMPECAPAGSDAEAAAAQGVAHVPAAVLVHAAVTGDTAPLAHAFDMFNAAKCAARRAGLDGLDGGAGGGSDAEGGTEGGTRGEEGAGGSDAEGETEVTLLDVGASGVGGSRGRRRAAAAASAAVAASGGGTAEGAGRSPGGGRSRRKRAAAVAGVENEGSAEPSPGTPAKRRRKGLAQADVNSNGCPQQQQQQQQQQQEEEQPDEGQRQQALKQPKASAAALQAHLSAGKRDKIIFSDLVVMKHTPERQQRQQQQRNQRGGSAASPAAGGVPNFKAFRPKGQGAAALVAAAVRVPLEVYDDGRRQDADAQAFAKWVG
jgi:hypothetical protein